MSKAVIYDTEAKAKILAGVDKLEKAVAVTLGPCGKNVLIDEYGSVHPTKDGVTVARSIELSDRFEGMGAAAVKEAAQKSADRVGDGTTTSTILAAQIYRNGLKYVSLGSNATQVKNGVKKAADKAAELVKAAARPVADKEGIRRVAMISANGDRKIGDIIAEVMGRLGADGTVKVENGNGIDTTYQVVEGMVVDKSYASPYMVTNPETMEAELDEPWVLTVDRKLSNFQEILPLLQAVAGTGRPLLIVAESFADEVLATLVMNKMRGGLNSVAVTAPSYGDNRKAILEDIAVLCGGRVVSDTSGVRIEDALPGRGALGQARRVVVNRQNTVVMGGRGDKAAVDARVKGLRAQIEAADEFDRKQLEERLARMTSGIGVITVGATTEAERKELRDRVDDAFCAAKAAMRGGIVPGGGVALLNAAAGLGGLVDGLVGDEQVGARIFRDALDAPARKIVENAGLDAPLVVGRLAEDRSNPDRGYDAASRQYVDMVEAGIVDPAEVVVNEIANAASVSGLLLTTEVLVTDEPEDKAKAQPAA